jgi:predicted regulator of Ras-like GTPase activity (Roadblock/LC7/MglB family)
MTIPFLSYFKRGKAKEEEAPAPAAKAAPAPIDKPSSERFKKTVMPNATRSIAPQDPFEMASRSTALGGQMPSVNAPGPRTVSFTPSSPTTPARGLPPAVALALEPTVERVLSIELSDVVTEMPPGYCKPMEVIDTSRRILLKASEVEKGMATGKPAVSLATVYQQVPEIFIRRIADSDTTQLTLPFQKVLDAFANMHVRPDQERAGAVPQVETPFLKVTLEDNETFGTTTEPLETGELPPVRLQPPTAEAFAAAEPEEVGEAMLRMSPPSTNGNGHTASTPKRIPFKLSPNGTDAPAPESVPASSGPSVPNFVSADTIAPVELAGPVTPDAPAAPVAPVSAAAPVRIPFKIAMPEIAEEVKAKPEPWLTRESMAKDGEPTAAPEAPTQTAEETPRSTEVKISLPLLPILKNLPPIQLTSDPGSVPPDVHIELPFALVEPQLASGRVSVTAKVFEVSLPVSFRGLFQAGPGAVDVALPLQEVLKNLPAASLRMRDDQEEQEAGANFATPFSAKAEEDAKRLNVSLAPVAKPETVVPAAVVPAPEAKAAAAPLETAEAADKAPLTDEKATEEKPADRGFRSPLQVSLGTDEKLDAKGVVALVNKIPGVKSCAIHFGDGLSLAGSLPAELETDGICAMAPALMQRAGTHLIDSKLGSLRGMTLSCSKATVTFFMHENLCLAVLHADLDLPGETREKLSRIVHELSRKYSHPV